MSAPFRGYTSKRYWARAKWRGLIRFLRRLPHETRRAIRHIWWRWTSERNRVIEERDRLAERNEFLFKWAKMSDQALYELKVEHRGATIETLRLIADEIDCEPGCERVSPMDWTTGVTECSLSDRGECPFDKACALRELATALETKAASDSDEHRNGIARE